MNPNTDEKEAGTFSSSVKANETPESADEPSTSTPPVVPTEGPSEEGNMTGHEVLFQLIQILKSKVDAWVVVEPSFIPLHVEFRVIHEDLKLISHAITDFQEATTDVSTTHLSDHSKVYRMSSDSPEKLQI